MPVVNFGAKIGIQIGKPLVGNLVLKSKKI